MAASPPSFTPSSWTNQRLTLYHGMVDTQVASLLTGIDVRKGRLHTDFGQAFYTSTVERQTASWAWQLSRRLPGTLPAVIRFDVDRDHLADLESLPFARGNFDADDFWSLVFHCRSGGSHHGRGGSRDWYDVVIGPVAASWRQRLTIYDADQVSFHTERAAMLLNASSPRTFP